MGEAFSVIFIANVFVMNGGSTFILRMSREYNRRGHRCAVLLLRDLSDQNLLSQLKMHADVMHLSDFQISRRRFSFGLAGVFGPIKWRRLLRALRSYGSHVHAMSIFGLVLALRLSRADAAIRPTVGIYHQNEFIFRASRFFFPTFAQAMFAKMPAENIVFFNESSRDNYAAHFRRDYSTASLLPIGVELEKGGAPRRAKGYRIVSIGNLEGFKTYNRHVITVVADLQKRLPLIAYDIYGCGPLEGELRQYATDLKVDHRVHFRGYTEYSKFREIVADCDLFVGSGTALLEAAAAGRPALIGIESIEIPETYGYLCDAEGFSYNEMRPGAKLIPIAPLVENLLSDSEHWTNIANACEYKAHEFSIQRTIEGFDKLYHAAKQQPVRLSALQIIRMGGSAVMMRVSENLRLREPFGARRNQSY